jgi:hypothetical protein
MGVARWAARPDQTTGYNRTTVRSTEEKGSGMGSSLAGSAAQWHPTVRFLLALVVAEIFAFGALRAYTKHGG